MTIWFCGTQQQRELMVQLLWSIGIPFCSSENSEWSRYEDFTWCWNNKSVGLFCCPTISLAKLAEFFFFRCAVDPRTIILVDFSIHPEKISGKHSMTVISLPWAFIRLSNREMHTFDLVLPQIMKELLWKGNYSCHGQCPCFSIIYWSLKVVSHGDLGNLMDL